MTSDSIVVDVDRSQREPLDASPTAVEVEAGSSVDVLVRGHAGPAHVHCRLDDTLSRIATLPQSNFFVDAGGATRISIDIDTPDLDDRIDGLLEISTGFGAESIGLDVAIVPGPPSIEVDESLAKPPGRDDVQTASEDDQTSIDSIESIGLVALAAVALLLGIGTAAITEGVMALFGVAIVLVAITTAAILLYR